MATADETDPTPDGQPPEPALPALRPGPAVLDADSWEEHGGPEPIVETYEGRRRAAPTSARTWVVLAVLLGLAAVVAVPLALLAGRDRPDPAAAGAVRSSDPSSADGTTPGSGLVPATGALPKSPPTTTPAPRPPGSTTTTVTTTTVTTTTTTSAVAFAVTLEAEGPGTVAVRIGLVGHVRRRVRRAHRPQRRQMGRQPGQRRDPGHAALGRLVRDHRVVRPSGR